MDIDVFTLFPEHFEWFQRQRHVSNALAAGDGLSFRNYRDTTPLGAGQVDVDLTGDRKADLTAEIEGGVGEATVRLPKNVGVIVNASGGLGSIDAHGLKHDGDEYTNELYGRSPVTVHVKVEGGVGRIVLTEEP